jgi:hypothetical protein
MVPQREPAARDAEFTNAHAAGIPEGATFGYETIRKN